MPVEMVCESHVTRVIVYARGALVTRTLVLPSHLPAGDLVLVVPGVTHLADAGSARATVEGAGRYVLAVRSRLVIPGATPTVPQALPDESKAGSGQAGPSRLETVEADIRHLRRQLDSLQKRRMDLLATRPLPRLGPARKHARVVGERLEATLACGAMLDRIVVDLDARSALLRERLGKLQIDLAAARLEESQASAQDRSGAQHRSLSLLVRLAGDGPVTALEVSYTVPAARWWPVYTLRLVDQCRRARWVREALVAQLAGEDWTGVRIHLTTADMVGDQRLPELPSLRLGRAQSAPRKAFRPPPAGLDRMFEGYDRAFGLEASAPTGELGDAAAGVGSWSKRGEVSGWGSEDCRSALPPPPPPPCAPCAPCVSAPMPQAGPVFASESVISPRGRSAPEMQKKMDMPFRRQESAWDGIPCEQEEAAPGGGGHLPPPGPSQVEPQEAWLDFDRLRLAPLTETWHRGRLALEPVAGIDAGEARVRVEVSAPALAPPDPRLTRGTFDRQYGSEGVVDIPSDGAAHRIPLDSASAIPTIRWRTVPREAAEVYREVALSNPFATGLLPGPMDVFVEGSLVVTTPLDAEVGPGGTVYVGLGLEDRIRVARNVRVEEERGGILGDSTNVTHHVHLDLASAVGEVVDLEVLERLPVSDEKAVRIKVLSCSPESEPYAQDERHRHVRGGMRWRLSLPAGGGASVEYSYRITLPSKNEIVGGNRRD